MWGIKICGVYLIDALFAGDLPKFISGALLSLSAMIQLELPHVNVLTKCDLVDEQELEQVLDFETATLLVNSTKAAEHAKGLASRRLNKLTYAICSVLDDFTMVNFLPLNIKDEESVSLILQSTDHLTQYGEDLEPRDPAEREGDE